MVKQLLKLDQIADLSSIMKDEKAIGDSTQQSFQLGENGNFDLKNISNT
jgi:hypothetical protein